MSKSGQLLIERINKNIFIIFLGLSGNIKEIIKKFIFKEVERMWITKGDVHIVNSLSGKGKEEKGKDREKRRNKKKKVVHSVEIVGTGCPQEVDNFWRI